MERRLRAGSSEVKPHIAFAIAGLDPAIHVAASFDAGQGRRERAADRKGRNANGMSVSHDVVAV
jgi:hypothetical protein